MSNVQEDIETISEKTLASKKYKDLYPPTVKRVVTDVLERYGKKRADKEARSSLHQIWGAYWKGQPNYNKLIDHGKNHYSERSQRRHAMATCHGSQQDNDRVQENLTNLLQLHSSTNERLPILQDFYHQIFTITGLPSSIIDHACGFNPLTRPWMGLTESTTYQAYDIDVAEIDFLNTIFAQNPDLFPNTQAKPGDILTDEPEYADVVFMLKLVPVLEQQEKGSSLRILQNQPAQHIVVSFPTASIGGKDKGMVGHYREWFLNEVKEMEWDVRELLFETELVFVVGK